MCVYKYPDVYLKEITFEIVIFTFFFFYFIASLNPIQSYSFHLLGLTN